MQVERLPGSVLAERLRPITRAYLAGDRKLLRRFAVDWRDEAAIAARARSARAVEPATADAIEAYLRKLGAPPESLESLARLRGGAACVVTGQQPGAFGGPLYNFYKAATAVRLARRLGERGIPVVPVFWTHADDHNPADVGRISLPGPDNTVRDIDLGLVDDGRPLGDRTVDPAAALKELETLLPDTPHRPAVLAALKAASTGTLSESFSRVLLRWLGRHGLIVLEPSHLEGARAQAVFDRALREPGLIEQALKAETALLEADGFEGSLGDGAGSGLFLIKDGRRRRVERSGDRYYVAGAPLDGTGRLSAGVALRPVLQDAALPTAAYVAGPNEVAYFAQLGGLYRAFDVPMPAVVPRAGATIIEPRVSRVIEKFDLKAEDLFAGPEELLRRISARAQKSLIEEVSRLDLDLRARLKVLEGLIDKGLVDALHKTGEKLSRPLAAFRERIVEAQRQSDQVAAGQIAKLAAHLTPGGALQERKFTPWYYQAMLGVDLVDRLLEAIEPLSGAHLLVRT